MRVTISVGGLWHASDLAPQLAERDALVALHTSLPRFKLPRKILGLGPLVHSHGYIDALAYGATKVGFPRVGLLKARTYDEIVSRSLSPTDIFVCWSSFGVKSIRRARGMGAMIILERGSAHIREQDILLKDALRRAGRSSAVPIDPSIISREESEYELADFISVPSNFALESFLKWGIRPERLVRIPYGVDHGVFNIRREVSHYFSHTLNIVFIGNVGIRKGIPILMEVARVFRDVPSIRFNVVGGVEPDFSHYIAENAKENVNFTGKLNTDSLLNVIRQSHIFLLPSIEEGFARVILETMSCGVCPLVSTHTGGSDVVVDGENGYTFDPYDVERIVDLLRILNEDRMLLRRVSESAASVARNFTWDEYGRRMYEFYESIMGVGY